MAALAQSRSWPARPWWPAVRLASAEDAVVIRAGVLIDGKGEGRRDQVIVVRGNRIEASGDAAAVKAPAGAAVVDLSRATVLPGLIDSHTHLFLQGEDPGGRLRRAAPEAAASPIRAARATVSARRALEQGFTTIRDVETEGAGYGDVGIKQAIERGYIPGPRMFVVDARHLDDRRLSARGLRAGDRACPRARRSWTARSRRARPRASSSTTARTGSRST